VGKLTSSDSTYQEGKTLNLHLVESFLSSAATLPNITVRITHLFQPSTLSVVMKVDLENDPQPAILKLFDNRFTLDLREDYKCTTWNEGLEAAYLRFIQSGEAEKFVGSWEDDDREWTPAQIETWIRMKCCEFFRAEVSVYKRLVDLQGDCIPKLLGIVSMKTQCSDDLRVQEHTVIHGLLLSYHNGFNLSDLADNASKEDWQSIGDKAVNIVNLIGDYGVLNQDVRPENCIVTKRATGPKHKVFLIDFGLARLRGERESDREWLEAKCRENEEHSMGAVIDIQLRQRGGGYSVPWARRWGFFGNDNR
jgi:hypothetical protein